MSMNSSMSSHQLDSRRQAISQSRGMMLVLCVAMMSIQQCVCDLNTFIPDVYYPGRKLLEQRMQVRGASVVINSVTSCSITACPSTKAVAKLVKKNLITFTVDEVRDAPTAEAKKFEGAQLTTFGGHGKDLVDLMAADPDVDSRAHSLISGLDYCPLAGDVVLTMKVTVTDVKALKGSVVDVGKLGLPLELVVTMGHEARMKGRGLDVVVLAA